MGGGFSAQGMITSLSNNKKLLRRQSIFKPEQTFLHAKQQYLKNASGDFNFKTATKEELAAIRSKIRKRNVQKIIF